MPHTQQEVKESSTVLQLFLRPRELSYVFCAAGELLRTAPVVGIWFLTLLNVLGEVQERVETLTKQ